MSGLRNITPSKLMKPVTIIVAICAIVGIVFLSTTIFVVDQTERAVVTTFGAFSYIAEPGLHVKLPFGIQESFNIPTTVQKEEFGYLTTSSGIESEYDQSVEPIRMLTGDLNVVRLEWDVQYKIVDPKAWQFNVYWRHRLIRDVAMAVMNQLVGDSSFIEVTGAARTRIEGEAMNMMNDQLRSFSVGINVISVQFQNVEMPKEVQAASDDISNARSDYLRLRNEGQQAYNSAVTTATAQAQAITRQAEGEVFAFDQIYQEYVKAPDIIKQRMYFEMMEAVFGGTKNVTLVDKNLGGFLSIKNLGAKVGE